MKSIKNRVSLLLALLMTFALFVPALPAAVSAAEPVDITADFTDDNFKAEVYKCIGKTAPDAIYDTDVANIRQLVVDEKGISDLSGIENFTSLLALSCNTNELTTLDVTSLPQLKVLYCSNNDLTDLKVQGNLKLELIDCKYNKLTELDFSDLPKLKKLDCINNPELKKLDLTNTAQLYRKYSVYCTGTGLFNPDTNLIDTGKLLGKDVTDPDFGVPPTVLQVITYYELPYSDIADEDWYFKDIHDMHFRDLVNGTDAVSFSPDSLFTRAMAAALLYRIDNMPDAVIGDLFNDVDGSSPEYYSKAVYWGAENDIIEGYPNGNFMPETNITRAELVTVLYRYAVLTGALLPETNDCKDLSDAFDDAGSIPEYAKEAVLKFYNADIIKGMPGNIFDPNGNATRAEAVVMIERFIDSCDIRYCPAYFPDGQIR